MTRRIAGAVVTAALVTAAPAVAGEPGMVVAPVASSRVVSAPQVMPTKPPAGVVREARRVARAVAGLNAEVVRWGVAYCWRNAGRPWRCVLREWTLEGHCDGVATIMHETLENRRTGRVRVLRTWGTRKVRKVYCGV